ncbi:MAG: hypothetical protein JNJ88_10775 [Planctomycetes bacterium]|nr:hypothetical protein [Planctomycetota bacterium]
MCCALAALVCGVVPTWAQTTAFVNVNSHGDAANSSTDHADVSADGRFVVFASLANDRVEGDTKGPREEFFGSQSNGTPPEPVFSWDCCYLASASFASNRVGADTNHEIDVLL